MKKTETDDLFDEIFAEETKKKAPRVSGKGAMGPSGANMGPSGADMMRPVKKSSRRK